MALTALASIAAVRAVTTGELRNGFEGEVTVAREVPVSVDRDFARFGSKSYAINKINSVEVRRRYPNGQGLMFIVGLLAVICFAGGAGTPGGGSMVVLGLFLAALAFWLWRRSRIVEYQLFLMTSSSEAQALTSRDPSVIDQLRERIEQAMAGQLT